MTQPSAAPSTQTGKREDPLDEFPTTSLPAVSSIPTSPPMASINAVRAAKAPDLGAASAFKVRLAMRSLKAQYAASLLEQSVRIERLRHVEIGAHLLAPLAVEFLTLGGEQDDVNVAQAEFVLHGVAHV